MSDRNKIKLLAIAPLPPPVGGVAEVFKTLIEGGLRENFDFRLLEISDRRKRALSTQGRFSIGNLMLGLRHCLQLFWRLVFFRPQVVYLSYSSTKWAAIRDAFFVSLARIFRAEVVIRLDNSMFREFYENGPDKQKRRIEKVIHTVKSINVTGESIRNSLSGLVPEEKMHVIPNGVESEIFLAIADRRRNRRPTGNILYMGWLTVEKGVLDLVKAFNLVAEQMDDCHLYLAGPWVWNRDTDAIAKCIKESHFTNRIHLLGVVRGESKIEAFEKADVFAMPTTHPEAQPMVLIEALGAGLPIVATDVGDIPFIVRHGEGGFIIQHGAIEEIADKTKTLFSNREIYKKFSSFNVELFKQEFTQELFVKRVIDDLMRVWGRDDEA